VTVFLVFLIRLISNGTMLQFTFEQQKRIRTLLHLLLRGLVTLILPYLAVMLPRYGQERADGTVVPTYGLGISFF
jgi:hypothetical protein